MPVLLRRAVAATVPAPAPPGTVLISHPGRVVSPIKRALIRDLVDSIHPHPTLSETLGAAAEVFLGTATDLYRPRREKVKEG